MNRRYAGMIKDICVTRAALTCAAAVMMSLAFAAAACCAAGASTPVMPVSEVKAGMKGKGLTVMRGSAPMEFEVEIIGVLGKANAGGDLILGKLVGAEVEHTGVAAGMSGSPIYVDGKLIGALAFAWSFSKDPICGITPIEDMLTTMNGAPAPAGSQGKGGAEPAPRFRNVLGAIGSGEPEPAWKQSAAPARGIAFDAPGAGAGQLQPIATPLMVSGFTGRARAALEGFFEAQTGFPAITGGSSASGNSRDSAEEEALKPGGVITVPLMTGDFEAVALGTVTWRDGDNVLAFGHPMFNGGAVELPMAGGRVEHVMANQTVSFKMGDPSKIVGSLVFDKQYAIRGVVGRMIPMTPVTIKVSDVAGGVSKNFNIQVVGYRKLPYGLIVSAMMNGIGIVAGDSAEVMATARLSFKFKGLAEPIVLNDMYYADDAGYLDLSERLTEIVDNPFQTMELESADAEISLETTRRTASVMSVTIASDRIQPGDTITANVELKDFDGGDRIVPVAVNLAKDAPAGMYKIVALGGNGLYMRDTPPVNFPQYIDDTLRRAPMNSLVTVLVYPEKAAALRGETLLDSPSTMRDLMAFSSFSGVTPVDKTQKILMRMDSVIIGQAMAAFTIEQYKPAKK